MKITKKEISLVESYGITLVTTGFGIYSAGNHDIKKVAWSAAIAVLGPVWLSGKAKVKAWAASKAVEVVIPVEVPAKKTVKKTAK